MCFAELLTATATSRKVTLLLRITRSWKQKRKPCAPSLIGTRAQASALVPSLVSSTNVASRPASATGAGNERVCGDSSETLPILAAPALEKRNGESDNASHGECGNVVVPLPARVPATTVPVRNGLRFLCRP